MSQHRTSRQPIRWNARAQRIGMALEVTAFVACFFVFVALAALWGRS